MQIMFVVPCYLEAEEIESFCLGRGEPCLPREPGHRPDHPPQGRKGPRISRSCWKGDIFGMQKSILDVSFWNYLGQRPDPQGRGWREEEKEDWAR